MNGKRLQALICLVVLLVGGWLAVRWWVSPERRINKNIKRIQKLVSKSCIKALTIAIFPGASRFYIGCLRPNGLDPAANRLGNKLWPIV